MTILKWHAYYYDGDDNSRPPVKSNLIEAHSANEAMEIARARLGNLHRAELAPLRWEAHTPHLSVTNPSSRPRN